MRDSGGVLSLGLNVLLWTGWLRLHAPALRWLGATFTGEGYRLNLGMLVAVTALLLHGVVRGASLRALTVAFSRPPRATAAPLLIAGACATGYLFVERWLDVDIASCALFGLGTWALGGLHVSRDTWGRSLPAALLVVAVLPFGEQANTYIGFAARLLTARAAAPLLALLGAPVISAETVLFLENGAAHVDVPCSGVRSLWIGGVFLLGAVLVEKRRLDVRFVAAAALLAIGLVFANIARVTAVIGLSVVLGMPRLADLLHAPIGVLGFAAACAAALLLLRLGRPRETGVFVGDEAAERHVMRGGALARADNRWFTFGVVASVWGLSFAHRARPPAPPAPPFVLRLPADFSSEPVALTAAEADLFGRFAGGAADKRRFTFRGHRGTLLVAAGSSFRAHHPPEICLAAAGVHVDRLDDVRFGPGRAARTASLDNGTRAALYWYQSPSGTTADLLTRVFAQVSGRERRWAQVSLLVDDTPEALLPDAPALFEALTRAVSAALVEE